MRGEGERGGEERGREGGRGYVGRLQCVCEQYLKEFEENPSQTWRWGGTVTHTCTYSPPTDRQTDRHKSDQILIPGPNQTSLHQSSH